MKLLSVVLLGFACCSSLIAAAHEGHNHAPVSIKSALEISVQSAKNYSIKASPFVVGQLSASWASLSEQDAQIHENKLGYYVVSLHNPHEQRTLYFKILLDGTVAGANYTGNFATASANSSSVGTSGG